MTTPEDRFVDEVMRAVRETGPTYPTATDPLVGIWLIATPRTFVLGAALLGAAYLAVPRETRPASPRTVAEAIGVPLEFRVADRGDASVTR